jgi:putative ABC transport system permease protein
MFGIFSTALRHKIWFDLWGSKQRTLQAILTIAIGAFVIGTIFTAWGGISEDTRRSFVPTRPPSIAISLTPPADATLLRVLRADPQLAAVEGLMVASVNWRPSPDAAWRPATLQARDDYANQQLALLQLEGGAWPTGRGFAVERGFPIAIGERVELQIEQRTNSAAIDGTLYNLAVLSSNLGGDPIFYTSRSQFARLTGQDGFNQVIATVPDYSAARAAAAAASMQRTLRRYGFDVGPASIDNTKVADPNRAFFQDPIESVGVILQSIGVIAVLLGLLLIYNTVMAIVTQQTAQIGELKAIGATSRQILFVYFSIVLAYGFVALCLSVPLSLLAGNALRQTMVGMLGLTPADWIVLPTPIIYQVLICLVAPVLVATFPVLRGARVTVREAISSYGLSGGSRLDDLLARLRGLPRTVSLALSNAFRNPGRVVTTQLALAGAGLTFMAVLSARAALIYTLGGLLVQAYPYQVQLDFGQPVSLARVEQATQLAGVTSIEGWRLQTATIRRADAPEQVDDPSVLLTGVPLPSASYQPTLNQGRGLQPGDTYALMLHERQADELGVTVGDWVLVSIPDPTGERRWASQERWQVQGVLINITAAGSALVPRATLFDVLSSQEVNRLQLQSADASPDGTAALAVQVRAFFEKQDIDVQTSDSPTVTQRSEAQLANTSVVIALLLVVALIVAGVGAISLNGTLSIAVLERRREIGVLRAIGSTPSGIRTQLVIEGLVMGLLSWLIAFALSYPASLATAQLIGASLNITLVFQYEWLGVWVWLGLATVISIIASLSPAQQAIGLSVQESIAYE